MSSLQSYLERMGSNFLVAGFIPALAFVALIMFSFGPILPQSILNRLGGSFNPISENGIISLIFAIVLGFSLTSLNNFLIKVFEGYILLEHFPFLLRNEKKRERLLRKKIDRINTKVDYFRKRGKISSKHVQNLLRKRYSLKTELDRTFPKTSEIMSTPFGNILKAAEFYPLDRYNIDSVTLWPRLVNAISPSYHLRIDETRNQLSFLVNCGFLAFFFSLLSLLASVYQYFLSTQAASGVKQILYFLPIDLSQTIYFQRSLIYLVIAVFSMFVFLIFYRASLLSVAEFGDMIRGAYDLFRFELLKQLHFDLPSDSTNELDVWESICYFINIGRTFENNEPLTFQHNSSANNCSPEIPQ